MLSGLQLVKFDTLLLSGFLQQHLVVFLSLTGPAIGFAQQASVMALSLASAMCFCRLRMGVVTQLTCTKSAF
ncbi:hypothetical protein PAHAL_1G049500 [Panicum hallii]|jgi:hypothetical protein|uniref:Uncharacterized protein n=1 Tax=Panicum hallii TaxID=206008 RepID=A0A2T8KU30_9POAL|nr:hypothetical protein PAHAL_1G049500 [Panicum hallii]